MWTIYFIPEVYRYRGINWRNLLWISFALRVAHSEINDITTETLFHHPVAPALVPFNFYSIEIPAAIILIGRWISLYQQEEQQATIHPENCYFILAVKRALKPEIKNSKERETTFFSERLLLFQFEISGRENSQPRFPPSFWTRCSDPSASLITRRTKSSSTVNLLSFNSLAICVFTSGRAFDRS